MGAGPDLWVPESTQALAGLADPAAFENAGSIATSPLVVVVPQTEAASYGWPDGEFSWSTAFEGDDLSIIDPETSAEGLVTLSVASAALGDGADPARLTQAMSGLVQHTVPTTADAFEGMAAAEPTVKAFAASEQAVARRNASAAGAPVVALYPTEGTLAFDHPAMLPVPDDGTPADDRDDAVRAFVDYLLGEHAQRAVREAGLRAADGSTAEDAGVVDGIRAELPSMLPTPDTGAVTQVRLQWAAVSMDMRTLAVIDVSGSMADDVEGGTDDESTTRIELTRDAAKNALSILPSTSSVGMWAFSVLQDPPDDHVELVPVGPLSEEVGGRSRLEALSAAADSLPGLVGGGTGLYDTTLAAFEQARDTYEEGKVNSVVLMTDGRDEDDDDSIGLEALLTALADGYDPDAPVPIITIGIGPEADLDALEQISAATGTSAFQANDPRDIENVFLQAMIERQAHIPGP